MVVYRAKNVRIVSMSQYLWTWLCIYIYIYICICITIYDNYFIQAINFIQFIILIHSESILYKHMHNISLCIYLSIYLSIRGGTVLVFVPIRHGTDLSVRCVRSYNEYRQFTLNPEGGAHSNATLFDNRQQKNSECRELHTWKQSPLDSDHVLILNTSLT